MKVVFFVMAASGTTHKVSEKHLDDVGSSVKIDLLQKEQLGSNGKPSISKATGRSSIRGESTTDKIFRCYEQP